VLIVCGSHVGANEAVMAPLRRNLGDRLVGVFDETTPEKDIETVYDGIETMEAMDPDALIGVGGGSSLDIARQMSVFAAAGRSLSDVRGAAHEGTIEPPEPDGKPTPVIVVPTTFAGADLSSGASVTVLEAEESPTAQPIRTGGSVRPIAMIYDPDLFRDDANECARRIVDEWLRQRSRDDLFEPRNADNRRNSDAWPATITRVATEPRRK